MVVLRKIPIIVGLLVLSCTKTGAFVPQNLIGVSRKSSVQNANQNRISLVSYGVNEDFENSNANIAEKTQGLLQDMRASSKTRRDLLRAMLAVSVGSTVIPPAAEAVTPTLAGTKDAIAEGRPKIPDWSGIKVVIPPSDDREYEVLVLENGLRVVLCSDPSSNEAGAAMNVHVGACSDPKDIPGLAHFNEHMLFLGTKEYPNENSFEEFLVANGGSSNAYTASENTCYYFTLRTEEADGKLEEGLKRFGSFFTSPLFTEAATGRELNAIESENSKNLQSDSFRVYQINKERQNTDHPHSKFFTGNKKTLLDDTKKKGINLRQSLIEFYQKYYSSDQMTLAVVGPQSIESLKEMAKSAFSEVPNRNGGAPEEAWKGVVPPFDATNSVIPSFGNVVKIVPVSDLRQVTVTWPVIYKDDKDHADALLTKQAHYVSHIIGHEGPGSLLSYLKSKGWVNSLVAGGEGDLSDFETFEITASLTRSGFEKVDQVVEAIYSIIKMMRDQTIPKYIFDECLQLEELGWRFSSKGSVDNFVQSLSSSLREYPPSLCVAGTRRLALCQDDTTTLLASNAARTSFDSPAQFEYTTKLVADFVDNLTVDNAMYTILSKSYKGQTNQKEFWYGTEYRVDPVPLATTLQWKNPTSVTDYGIAFPRKNIFIPSEKGLKLKFPPKPVSKAPRTFEERMTPIPPPRVVRDDGPNGRWTVYYKPDDIFGQPKAFVIFELLTKEVYSSATAAALSNMYEFCVADKLTEYAYDAGLAGLTYDVRVIPRGVRLTFGGYNDKLEEFAKYVSNQITADLKNILPKDESEFDRYKDLLIRGFEGFNAKQPYAHCSYYTTLLMKPPGFEYDNKELLAATEELTLSDLTSYVSSVWSSGKGIALVQGNVDEKQALALVSSIDKTLGFKPISKEEYPPELAPIPLPESPANSKGTRLVISEPNAENGNAASYVSIQGLSEEPKEHVLMELVGSIVSEPFYEDLRTKQQLGYIVSSGIRAVGKTKSLGFIVQSSTAKNDKLTAEILKYMDNIRPRYLETLGSADFAVYVKSLIDRKTEPDKQLAAETTRNWAEISSGRLEFDRSQKEVAALLDLKKEDLLDFWDRLYVNDGRRVLITEMIPQVGPTSGPKPAVSNGYASSAKTTKTSDLVLGIGDIKAYRQDRGQLV